MKELKDEDYESMLEQKCERLIAINRRLMGALYDTEKFGLTRENERLADIEFDDEVGLARVNLPPEQNLAGAFKPKNIASVVAARSIELGHSEVRRAENKVLVRATVYDHNASMVLPIIDIFAKLGMTIAGAGSEGGKGVISFDWPVTAIDGER